MTDPSIKTSEEQPKMRSSVVGAFLAGASASYIMTQLSLAGVNFTTLGVDSEVVKATLVGQLVVFFAWVTPRNVVLAIKRAIIFFRDSAKELQDTAEGKQ